MSIKLFTMVKNENDIIEYWIKYHGKLFGYSNLYIVDNMSNDGTYEIIEFYQNYGVNIFREKNYKEKGDIMTRLIKETKDYDIAFPLDIDEFIVHYKEKERKVDPEKSVVYLQDLIKTNIFKKHKVFKANYINSMISDKDKNGYKNALVETEYGRYDDYGSHAKSFLNVSTWDDVLDHGNHFPTDDYYLSEICLVHYHTRSTDQMIKKVENNVEGLGYPINDLNFLESLDPNCHGCHHVKHMISIIKGTFSLPVWDVTNTLYISLKSIGKFSKNLNIIP